MSISKQYRNRVVPGVRELNIETQILNTIADLQALPSPVATDATYKVMGYRSKGDCDIPVYRWNATSINNNAPSIRPPNVIASAAGRWELHSSISLNVRWFGATGDGIADDTGAFTACILAARALGVATIIPAGTYRCSSLPNLIDPSDALHRQTSLLGEPTGGSIIKSLCTGTNPCILIEANSGYAVDSIVENLVIYPETNYQGTAIKINATNKSIIRHCKIEKNNYGIWFTNDTPNLWCELNHVQDCWIDRNNNGIRLEHLSGLDSFHGLTFKECWGAVQAGQTFLNHVSGFWYNGQFDLHVWTESMTSAVVNCNGSAQLNKGTIQVENFEGKGAVITGNGRFWYEGQLIGLGVVTDQTDQTKNDPVFSCTNWSSDHGRAFTSTTAQSLELKIDTSINGPLAKDNGSQPGFFAVNAPNIASPALIGFANAGNGLHYFNGGFQASLESATLRWQLSQAAELIGYEIGPKVFRHGAPYKALETRDNGRLKSDCGQIFEGNISIGQTSVSLDSDYSEDGAFFQFFSIRLWGTGYEFRALYSMNHQGFGGDGIVAKISDGFLFPNAAVTNVGITMDSLGNPVLTVDTTIDLQYKALLEAVGKK